jgi:predicted anti-sigma-YlaC factor YlaD
MFCDETLDAIEAIAAGELTAEGRVAAHLATCRHCAAALDSARRLDKMLAARPVPTPPQQFTVRTMTRIRRARWRSDQFLDVGFNVAIALIVIGIIGAGWLLLDRSGLTVVSGDLIALVESGGVALAQRVAPSVPVYVAAAALVATALGIWWWAERETAL